jgi:hypothetical protein
MEKICFASALASPEAAGALAAPEDAAGAGALALEPPDEQAVPSAAARRSEAKRDLMLMGH